MFTEDQLLPISALQHLVFCERQTALIHVEQVWAENKLTVEGKHLHTRADEHRAESRHSVRVQRALPIHNLDIGIVGQADVVEFHYRDRSRNDLARIVPVEYKRGRPKKDDSDRVQLCAQALCLEEMCATDVTEGALFYGQNRRRTKVQFESKLRSRTLAAIERLRFIVAERITPPAIKMPKCKSCSLVELCMPEATTAERSASRFMSRQISAHLRSEYPTADEPDG